MARYLDIQAIGNRDSIGHAFAPGVRSVIALITLIVVFGLWIEITGVRGVDQYWYLSDTQTLIDDGQPVTNTVFPAMVLRQGSADLPTYFLHNSPVLHVNAWIGELTGAFNAWKLSNLVLLVATAMLIGVTTARLSSSYGWGYCAYLIHLLSPLAVWQSANLFQESFLAFLSASLLFLLTMAQRHTAVREVAAALLFFGILCHPAFLCLAVCFVLWLMYERINIVRISLIGSAFVIAKVFQGYWFPSSFQPDLLSIITSSSVVYESNMIWHLSDFPVELNARLFYDKLVQGIGFQFFNLRYMPLTIVTNMGLVGFVVLLVYRRQQYRALLVLSFLLFGMLAGMIVLMQNVPRYQLIVAPAATLCLVLSLANLPLRWPRWPMLRTGAIAAGLLVFAMTDYRMLQYVKDAVREESTATDVLMKQLEHWPDDTRFALVDDRATERYVPLITALSPRPAMVVEPKLLSARGLQNVLNLYNPDIIITGSPDLLAYTGGEDLEVLPNGFYGPQTLFRIDH